IFLLAAWLLLAGLGPTSRPSHLQCRAALYFVIATRRRPTASGRPRQAASARSATTSCRGLLVSADVWEDLRRSLLELLLLVEDEVQDHQVRPGGLEIADRIDTGLATTHHRDAIGEAAIAVVRREPPPQPLESAYAVRIQPNV